MWENTIYVIKNEYISAVNRIVHPKYENSVIIYLPQTCMSLLNIKEGILKNVGNQRVAESG